MELCIEPETVDTNLEDRPNASALRRWGGEPTLFGSLPFLPDAGAPTGLVWPVAGRELLRRLAEATVERRDGIAGRQGIEDGSGTSDIVLLRAGDWCLKTSERRRTHDAEEAKSWLLSLARRKASLGTLAPEHTTLAAKRDTDGRFWVWTISPWVTTLRGEMAEAATIGDADALGSALTAFAEAVVTSIALAARKRMMLDVSPSNFARVRGAVRYIDDDATVGDALPFVGHAVVRRIDEYVDFPAALGRYVAAVEASIVSMLTPDEVRHVGLAAAFDAISVRSAEARRVQLRLREIVTSHANGRAPRPPVER